MLKNFDKKFHEISEAAKDYRSSVRAPTTHGGGPTTKSATDRNGSMREKTDYCEVCPAQCLDAPRGEFAGVARSISPPVKLPSTLGILSIKRCVHGDPYSVASIFSRSAIETGGVTDKDPGIRINGKSATTCSVCMRPEDSNVGGDDRSDMSDLFPA